MVIGNFTGEVEVSGLGGRDQVIMLLLLAREVCIMKKKKKIGKTQNTKHSSHPTPQHTYFPLFRAPRGQKISLERRLGTLKKSPGTSREILGDLWRVPRVPLRGENFDKRPKKW
jgi:hypothetical protein